MRGRYFRVLNQQYRPDDGFETHQGRHSFCVFIRVNYFGETAVKYKEPRSRLGCFSNQPKKILAIYPSISTFGWALSYPFKRFYWTFDKSVGFTEQCRPPPLFVFTR